MGLQHSDPEINHLISALENQRDSAMVANAALCKEVAQLREALNAAAEGQATAATRVAELEAKLAESTAGGIIT